MDITKTKALSQFFDDISLEKDKWTKQNFYYHQEIEKFYQSIVPSKRSILEVGAGHGDLLSVLKPRYGKGIDLSSEMVKRAKKKHKELSFFHHDIQKEREKGPFEYVLMCDLIANLEDVQISFENVRSAMNEESRIVITSYNYLWEPVLRLAEKLHLKMPVPLQNWLSYQDIQTLLSLADLEVVKKGRFLLLPIYIPIVSYVVNTYLAKLPILNHFCLVQYFVARKKESIIPRKSFSVSIIVPTRNEEGNIETLVKRIPQLGKWTETIFVEGDSQDKTRDEIKRVIKKYKGKKMRLIDQGRGKGKADAVGKGFAAATGDILMILDADMSVDPEDMGKFYDALVDGKGELVMGSRLVYPLEKQSMRLLNVLGNKFFSMMFSWILNEPIKDTLCGTKVLFKKNYNQIVSNRKFFGDFDPFGDFDLIFGAAKLNMKIIEIPVQYHARTYGTTNISRFRHGWLLLQMTVFALRKLKFN